ncbi:hypothetical protein Tco_1142662 [Tanacetum coccineum]
MTTTVVNNSVLRIFFEKHKLTGPNFIDWYRNIRIVMLVEDKLTYLEHPIPVVPVPAPGQELPLNVLAAHTTWVKASKEIAEQELLQTVREFHACKHKEGQSVSSDVLRMMRHINNLERCHPMSLNLAVSLILVSLSKEYDSFMQNYNMHDIRTTVNELHAMLKLHKQTLPKTCCTYASCNPSRISFLCGLSQDPPSSKKDNPVKDAICHQCDEGLRGSKKLKPRALNLYVGNGHRAVDEAIGIFHLCLPSRLVVVLNNFHFAPSITRGIILVSRLYDDGFVNHFENNGFSISMN